MYKAGDIATAGVGAVEEAAMKKQRVVEDILPPVSPIGVVAARHDGKIVLPRVQPGNLHEVTNKMKCVLHLKEEKKKGKRK